jgi:Tfp pilus assembly protein PilN
MINLLPPETKENLRYARRNRMLRRWIIVSLTCLFGAMMLVAGGGLYLQQSIDDTTKQIADTQHQLDAQHLTTVQKQVTDMSNNLKLTVQVLAKETLFSKLLAQLGAVTPSNVVLTNLSIVQDQGSIDITADAANYNAATQLQANLADPKNQIFSQADIENIACTGGKQGSAYPCQVTIRALFATDNPFLFINDKKKATP